MRALITGITGQDGSYLADLLLDKGYEVAGLVRRTSTPSIERLDHITGRITLFEGDLLDQRSLNEAVSEFRPTEVYNLAAQSFVGTSWTQPSLTAEITGLGCLKMLEAVRQFGASDCKFYQASSSEQFGKVQQIPQSEKTPFHPRSPYGVAKCYAHHITVNYRESYGMHASCGILFNHESPRRGLEFVTRKVTDGVARIVAGETTELRMGNLDARRDWGHARDYVQAMWLMLQQTRPDDYVIATGQTYTIRELLTAAFNAASLNWHEYVVIDESFKRPAEVDILIGDPTKAMKQLKWYPNTSFKDMITEMVLHDISRYKQSNLV